MAFEIVTNSRRGGAAIGVSFGVADNKAGRIGDFSIGSDVLTKLKWDPDAKIEIALGTDQDFGRARLRPNNRGVRQSMNGSSNTRSRVVRSTGAARPFPAHGRTTCEYAIEGDTLYVTLPDWAHEPAAEAAANPDAA